MRRAIKRSQEAVLDAWEGAARRRLLTFVGEGASGQSVAVRYEEGQAGEEQETMTGAALHVGGG